MTLEETIRRIRPVDQKAKEDAKAHWDGSDCWNSAYAADSY